MEREKIAYLIRAFRRFLIGSLAAAALIGVVCFVYAKELLLLLLRAVGIQVYYFALQEVFLSSVELALYAGLFFAIPIIGFILWHEFKGAVAIRPLHGYVFTIFAIGLFYGGSFFCYALVLRSGVTFLLGYEGGALKAMISVAKFVKFTAMMIFAFGLTFEVPVVLLLLSKLGVVKARRLAQARRYAVLIITVASALITPTPDVYNMALLAVPTYVLYEVGILLMRLNEARQGKKETTVLSG